MTDLRPAAPAAARPGSMALRPAPAGLPDPNIQPPTIAESGDPFSLLRILELVARLERGRAIRIDDIAAALNSAYLDWTFAPAVVTDALIGLQANWLSDYRNGSGIVLAEGVAGGHGHDRGLEPGRPLDRAPGRPGRRRLPGSPAGVQPARRDGLR